VPDLNMCQLTEGAFSSDDKMVFIAGIESFQLLIHQVNIWSLSHDGVFSSASIHL